MNERWKVSSHSVYNLKYHIIWTTKYRRSVLDEVMQLRLKELLEEKAKTINCEVVEVEIMEDHVHAFVSAKPTVAPHYIVQQLKGFSSKKMREEFKQLKSRLPTLWTRSYYVESIGHISESTIKKYIQNQKNV